MTSQPATTVMVSRGSSVEFSDNSAAGNHEDGIDIVCCSGGVKITHSTSAGNGRYGISTETGATGNTIDSNYAFGNSVYDVIENNSTCENKWMNNTYFTSHGPCFP